MSQTENQLRKWKVCIVRALNPKEYLVVKAIDGNEAIAIVEEDLYTVYGITDCHEVRLEEEIIEQPTDFKVLVRQASRLIVQVAKLLKK